MIWTEARLNKHFKKGFPKDNENQFEKGKFYGKMIRYNFQKTID